MGWSTSDTIVVRGKDLPAEVLGHVNLGDMAFLEVMNRLPTAEESAVFNAVAVTLVEHGMTPTAIAARLTYLGGPGAAGLRRGHHLSPAALKNRNEAFRA
jgi:citrate synthase